MPEQRTLEMAKAIVDLGIKYKAANWADPSNVTDKDIHALADELVTSCLSSSQRDSQSPAVLDILHAAQLEPLSETSRAAYAQRFGQAPATTADNGHAVDSPQPSPPSAPSEAQGSACREQASSDPVGSESAQLSDADEPAKEAAPVAGEDISDIFPGYDDLKDAQIKAAVLAEAKNGNLSPDEWERIQAHEAATKGRATILGLSPEFSQPEPESAAPSPVAPEPVPAVDGHDIEGVLKGTAITRAEQEGLPFPNRMDFSQQLPALPIDITNVSDEELSRIATAFHSYFAYGQLILSKEEGRERAAEHLEREANHDAYVRAYEFHKSEIPEDKRGPTALDHARKQAEKDAEGSEKVRELRAAKVRHGIEVRVLKALTVSYDRAVWRLTDELSRRGAVAKNSSAASRR